MTHQIKIKKGLDIPLTGEASGRITTDTSSSLIGIVPEDFPGYKWKCLVKPGDEVNAGTALLADKETGRIFLTSPIDGKVEEIRRGERRKILAVTVSRKDEQKEYTLEGYPFKSKDSIEEAMLKSGLWAMMRQRPYDIVPSPAIAPRDIFITAFDSAPLAPPLFRPEDIDDIQEGINGLQLLCEGKIFISFRKGEALVLKGAEIIEVGGPHPSGNVGVHIEKIAPVNKGETVWTLDIGTLCKLGKLFKTGEVDYRTVVAVTGPEAINPHLVSTIIGAEVKSILKTFIPADASDIRIISGNVLTGTKVDSENGFLRYPYRQITIIKEGSHADEFMGWASMSPSKFSVKRNFPAFLKGLSKPFPFDARIKGGHRAMILSGEYDKVFPMDIYPEYLIKAILAKDIDKMEQLGIYEVAPEDFALPEFVDTSKIELQKIVREGLDYLRSEL